LKEILEKDPPYGAEVHFDTISKTLGWNSPIFQDWLENSIQSASLNFFGKKAINHGRGGGCGMMCIMAELFHEAQFMAIGNLGPLANAHGANECLNIPYTLKLIGCIA